MMLNNRSEGAPCPPHLPLPPSPLPCPPDRVHSAGRSAGAGLAPAVSAAHLSPPSCCAALHSGWSWKTQGPWLGLCSCVCCVRAGTWLCGERAHGGLVAVALLPPLLQDLTLLTPQASAESLHQPLCDVLAWPGLHGVTLAWLPLDSALHTARALSTPSAPNRPGPGHLKGQRMDGGGGPGAGDRAIGN